TVRPAASMAPQKAATSHRTPKLVALECMWVFMYHGNMKKMKEPARGSAPGERLVVERVQTGVRMEKRLLKVLKAFAEYHDITLGDLLEGIVLHAFDGKAPFSPA